MGIKQLSKIIEQYGKSGVKERTLGYYSGKKIALDASLAIYQFLIAVRSEGTVLNTAEGETTSHLVGMFYRTIKMVENGLKPIYVFDGKPPAMKLNELQKRLEKREEATKKYKTAEEEGDKEKMGKYDKRTTKISSKHVEECKKLLKLLGVPYVEAPSEAEAYCSKLCLDNKVDAVGTEDMDALTFGAPTLLRNLNASESKKLPIKEYNLKNILTSLDLKMEEFIDLCILLGCDYCPSINGIGLQKAFKFIKKYKSIEQILQNEKNLKVPDDWNYKEARTIFYELSNLEDSVVIESDIKWDKVDIDGLVEFLVTENGFNEDRVRKGVERFLKSKAKSSQKSIDSFFKKK